MHIPVVYFECWTLNLYGKLPEFSGFYFDKLFLYSAQQAFSFAQFTSVNIKLLYFYSVGISTGFASGMRHTRTFHPDRNFKCFSVSVERENKIPDTYKIMESAFVSLTLTHVCISIRSVFYLYLFTLHPVYVRKCHAFYNPGQSLSQEMTGARVASSILRRLSSWSYGWYSIGAVVVIEFIIYRLRQHKIWRVLNWVHWTHIAH